MRIAATTLAAALTAGPSLAASLAVGEQLTPFTLKDATGKDVNLTAYRGSKVLILMFISTQCPISNAYNTRMAALAKDYAGRGVAFVGINSNREEAPEEIAEHARTNGFSFPVLKDLDNVQADRFGASVTPEAYVFDASWVLRYHGRIDDNRAGTHIQSPDLRNALDALLAGKDVPVAETKAFGCTIKRIQK
jgi:peroxiredoxin